VPDRGLPPRAAGGRAKAAATPNTRSRRRFKAAQATSYSSRTSSARGTWSDESASPACARRAGERRAARARGRI